MVPLIPPSDGRDSNAPPGVEFDNDTFLGSDDAFTAGWSFQVHSRLMEEWNDGFARWNGKLPGLGHEGADHRVVRWAAGLSQTIDGQRPPHTGVDENPGNVQALFGPHVTRVPVGPCLTCYRYLDKGDTGIRGSTDWVNFSFEYRF